MKDGIPLARSRQARDTDATRISTARSKCAWRARRCRRPSTIPPLLVRVIHQADVIVTRIVRDLLAGPCRLVEEFVFARKLKLRAPQPCVVTHEHLHLPDKLRVRHLVPLRIEQRSRAEQSEHLLGVVARYRVLVFVAPHTQRRALEIEECLAALHPHAYRRLLAAAHITLAHAHARRRVTPPTVVEHPKFPFDLRRHAPLRKRRRSGQNAAIVHQRSRALAASRDKKMPYPKVRH